MNKELSIQVFSVRDKMSNAEETKETFKALASYGFKGIQTAGACEWGYENYAAAAKEAGLKIIGTHLGIDLFEDIDETLRIHNLFETKYAGVGGMPGLWSADFCEQTVTDFIEKANAVAENFEKNGLEFTYHHHEREFAKIGNETIMEILVRELHKNTSFVLDTYWLQAGGVNILEWLKKLEGRVKILHLKDFVVPFGKGGYTITELGSGNINFKEVIKAAEATGVEHLCYEQDNAVNGDSLASAKQSAEYFYSII
ncbi:MAG: sugar phosphate isomerase/epimerase [Acutalibacteraceae bacterium]|nr:sugar phosphate isomerase/epimerase [Acutalibacteraceae bacterium]